jgi:DNA polymerase-3 subunit gamma/tau
MAQATLNWEQFQDEVSHTFPNIAPFLEMGRLIGIESNVITIGFAKQATVARAMLEKPDNVQSLTSLCERLSGQPVRLRIVEQTESDPSGPTMAQIRAAKEQEQRLVLFEQARAHPVVKQALEIFGAELADVRPVASQKEGQE